MIRSELIQIIADENPHLYQRDVERIVNTVKILLASANCGSSLLPETIRQESANVSLAFSSSLSFVGSP